MNRKSVEISTRNKSIALGAAIGGAFLGYLVGNLGGSSGEGVLWAIILGTSFYFLTISQIESSMRQNLITIAFHAGQVSIFAALGALLTWTTGDVTGLPLCLKIGVFLTTLTGIVNWEMSREMPDGFFFLLGIFLGMGAGAGVLVGVLFRFNAWASAVMGAFIALLLPYYFFQINARAIFLTFVLSTLGGMQFIFALGWSLLQGFYFMTSVTFGVSLVLLTVDYLQIHLRKVPRQNSLFPYLRL